MKPFSTDENEDLDEHGVSTAEAAWYADQAEALATHPRPRTVTLPGREPLDLESISDLWLD